MNEDTLAKALRKAAERMSGSSVEIEETIDLREIAPSTDEARVAESKRAMRESILNMSKEDLLRLKSSIEEELKDSVPQEFRQKEPGDG